MRPQFHLLILASLLITEGYGEPSTHTLTEARSGFSTQLTRKQKINTPVEESPPRLFRSVNYRSPIGDLAAYVSARPNDSNRHPAIIWIAGGFDNSIDASAWQPGEPENDQSASAFWKAGIITMYPSLRGGNRNPGYIEAFYGEVNDALAAADYLSKQDYVDPKRIYLGGHSTGGTLVLLAAEYSDRFRAIFAFGPVGNVERYGQEKLPFSLSDRREVELRSPGKWLSSIRNPTFIFEGTAQPSNISELNSMSRTTQNPLIHFHPIIGATHFSGLAPVSTLIAEKILRDQNSSLNIQFSETEITAALSNAPKGTR